MVLRTVVACLGDSITAGSPLWDPDAVLRARIGDAADPTSQWEHWAGLLAPRLRFRNHGVYGERTDEIAARLGVAVLGADVLVVQGGINDVVQGRPVDEALRNLAEMVEDGLRRGLAVVLADVLPWDKGDARAAADIVALNTLIRALAADLAVPLLPFHDTLVDPEHPARIRAGMSDDGEHPSVAGYRLLGERSAPFLRAASSS